MHRFSFLLAVTVVCAFCAVANAQFVEVVPSDDIVYVGQGPVTVEYQVFLDNEDLDTIDTGPAGIQSFFGWQALRGQMYSTAGLFQTPTENSDDVSSAIWEGRRPPSQTIIDDPGGLFGSFRWPQVASSVWAASDRNENFFELYSTSLGWSTESDGAMRAAQQFGTSLNLSGRVEVFRGSITLSDEDIPFGSDSGLAQITFEGLVWFYIEPSLFGFTAIDTDSILSFGAIDGLVEVRPGSVIIDAGLPPQTCVGDLTSSGATLEGQPGFGTPDGIADLDDLGYFLNFWLTGSPIADLTASGATLEGQPGFGAPDGTIDLDDLGYFLNFWLQGCP